MESRFQTFEKIKDFAAFRLWKALTIMTNYEPRQKLAEEIARYFYWHLVEEKEKSLELMNTVRELTKESPKEANEKILHQLLQIFPLIQNSPKPSFNLIEEWAKRNKFMFNYNSYVFDLYNRIFIERIISLKNPTPENEERFKETAIRVFTKLDYNSRGFSISFFIRVENNMRELLREIAIQIPGINQKNAWEMIFEQSKEYQEMVNTIFEKRLNDALDESEKLLRNILPIKIAEELKKKDSVEPVLIESATVLFTDFVGFTKHATMMTPKELLKELEEAFSIFDEITEKFSLEKIKTVGDAYMCAGGIPETNTTHALDVALAAIEIRDSFFQLRKSKLKNLSSYWDIRIGFHTGPLIAGVVSKKKFSYDIWGDTVNTASRMESSGEPGKINISEKSYLIIRDKFNCIDRGEIETKGKGKIRQYFLESKRSDFDKK